MERLAFHVDETEEVLLDVSAFARGIYLTLGLASCRRDSDDIAEGKVLIAGREATPEVLSTIYGFPLKETKDAYKELASLSLIDLDPVRYTRFYEDNKPYLGRRKFGKKKASDKEKKKYGGSSEGTGGGSSDTTLRGRKQSKAKQSPVGQGKAKKPLSKKEALAICQNGGV